MNNMIKSVVRAHHFTPAVIDALFHDDQDHWGLEYWSNDVRQVDDEIKALSPKK